MEQHFRNYQINHKFHEKGRGYYCWKLRKSKRKKSKKLKTFQNYSSSFQKLLISQSPQYNQGRQSQSSRGNVYKETYQELGISGNTVTIPS